jgi:hypothetical protein
MIELTGVCESSWATDPRHADGEPELGGGDADAEIVYRRAGTVREVSIALLRSTAVSDKCLHAFILLPLLILLFFNSIWNTYKDVFAKARTRELSIIA